MPDNNLSPFFKKIQIIMDNINFTKNDFYPKGILIDKLNELAMGGGMINTYFEIDDTILSQELLPNVAYKFTTRTNDLVLTLSPITDTTILNVYYFIINTGDTLPSITWPNGLVWYEDTTPTIAINKHYEFSIIDNVVKYYEV